MIEQPLLKLFLTWITIPCVSLCSFLLVFILNNSKICAQYYTLYKAWTQATGGTMINYDPPQSSKWFQVVSVGGQDITGGGETSAWKTLSPHSPSARRLWQPAFLCSPSPVICPSLCCVRPRCAARSHRMYRVCAPVIAASQLLEITFYILMHNHCTTRMLHLINRHSLKCILNWYYIKQNTRSRRDYASLV